MATCTDTDCDRGVQALGLCAMHYQRARRATRAACTVAGCNRGGVAARGLCDKHYKAAAAAGELEQHAPERKPRRTTPCDEPECDRAPYARGLCQPHYRAQARGAATTCTEAGCDRPRSSRGLCVVHYGRARRSAMPPCEGADCGRPQDSRGLCKWHRELERRADAGPCGEAGCDRPAQQAGLCGLHYGRAWRLEQPPCTVPGCDLRSRVGGLCSVHYVAPKYRGQVCAEPGCNAQAARGELCRHHGSAPARYRRSVFAAHEGRCGICDAELPEVGWHLDHIVTRDLGGSHDPHNLQPTCASCNQSKQGRLATWRHLDCGELVEPDATGTAPALGWHEGLVPVHVGCRAAEATG
jgi:5-methylcytosine-specific restriction endonuclease McrA